MFQDIAVFRGGLFIHLLQETVTDLIFDIVSCCSYFVLRFIVSVGSFVMRIL